MTEPTIKKRKLNSIYIDDEDMKNEEIDDDKAFVEKLIENMRISKENLHPVLSDQLTEEISTVEMFVGVVLEKQYIHKVISLLNSLTPLTEFQHLKRARNVEILLGPSMNMTLQDLKLILIENGFDYQIYLRDEFKVLPVVLSPPITKSQYEKANKLWPCTFHPNKYTEKLLSGNFFEMKEIELHRKYMTLAYEVAEMYEGVKEDCSGILKDNDYTFQTIDGNAKNNNSDLIRRVRKQLKELRGVVVVDPKINSIVAVGYDRRNHNPCQHPIMIAIDNVARSQHGGAWKDDNILAGETRTEEDNNVLLDGVPKMVRNILNATHENLRFGSRPTIRRATVGDPTSSPKDNLPTLLDFQNNVVDSECLAENSNGNTSLDLKCLTSMNADESAKPSGPYLCTGYDIYTTNEPCIMCSMSLIHSRARRVFYALKDKERGGLGSVSKLHTVSALNHHFEVFTKFFDDF